MGRDQRRMKNAQVVDQDCLCVLFAAVLVLMYPLPILRLSTFVSATAFMSLFESLLLYGWQGPK